jgi:uncharacterized YigZ family protein
MLAMQAQFRIITAGAQHETAKTKGSRFIATAQAFAAEPELTGLLQPLRRAFPEANHHCWAWRLGRSRDRFRWSDDGEPSGSAGRPILKQIEARSLTNVLVVVTRIFGGTKLGIGGLVRAYGDAASQVLANCPSEEWILRKRIDLTYAYEFDGLVKALLQQTGLQAESIRYDSEVHLALQVPDAAIDPLLAQLRDCTAGRIRVRTEGSSL